MLKEGEKAPEFELQDQTGRTVSLSDFAGKTVVVYFYPKDDTPGCTKEACSFRDNYNAFTEKGAVVLGISADPPASHEKFVAKYNLPFPLLSDPDKTSIRAFGAWGVKKMYGKEYEGIMRSTFVIGPDGVITKVFPKVKPADHAAEILGLL
ncbi:MAG: thioredoxin-dependent thiol peroxidase [Spirochaetaceae bacterium]